MINEKLANSSKPKDFISMGFVEEYDRTVGKQWIMKKKYFHILIDPWYEVMIRRMNPKTHFITIHVEDLKDLQSVVDWISNED